jgi:hypothetical protein
MYLLLVLALAAIFISAYIFTKLYFNHQSSALFLLISVLLYLLPMIGGALGILRPYFLVSGTLLLLLVSILVYAFKSESFNKSVGFNYIPIKYRARPLSLEVLLVIIPAICSLSLLTTFFVLSAKHKITNYYIAPYSWDVVEYHLPTLVHAVQTGSLWTTLWAHYPMGCEMMHSWGFVFLRNDALVYPTHFFYSFLLIFYSGVIIYALCFQDRKTISGTEIITYIIMAVLLLFSPLLWDMQFNQVGKNDIALAPFMMAALYYYLQSKKETCASENYKQNILLLGLALGLISGIKPNGLFYAAFFVGMLLKDKFSKKISLYSVGIVCFCILLLAGFWYIRTLIMLGAHPPTVISDSYKSVFFNLIHGRDLFFSGRDSLLFSLSSIFCFFMGLVWHKKDPRMRIANYTLAWSIVIFCLTPNSYWQGYMQLRLGPAIIPLVIIIGIATFLRLVVNTDKEKAYQPNGPHSWTYRRETILACLLLALGSVAMIAISRIGILRAKPHWAWDLRGLIVIGFLAAALFIYNSAAARQDYQLKISRGLLSCSAFSLVIITLVFQIIMYKPPGDLPGYNENTSVYRWVYQNIQGKTIYLLGLRPYGLYGKGLSNRVIYGGGSYGNKLEKWLPLLKKQRGDYLVVGRDYDQHEGWYDYKPFPRDLAKILAMPNIFKLVWSDHRAMIFSINQCSASRKPDHAS